jgi:hypothetical protein
MRLPQEGVRLNYKGGSSSKLAKEEQELRLNVSLQLQETKSETGNNVVAAAEPSYLGGILQQMISHLP